MGWFHVRCWIAAIVVGGVALGCGGTSYQKSPAAPEEAPEPSAAPEGDAIEDTADVGSLEADLEREERVLAALLASPAPVGQPAQVAPESPATVPPQDAQTGGLRMAKDDTGSSDGCDRACRSLQSMRRAADGICRLCEDEPDRCDRARSRVDRAEGLVERSGCDCS